MFVRVHQTANFIRFVAVAHIKCIGRDEAVVELSSNAKYCIPKLIKRPRICGLGQIARASADPERATTSIATDAPRKHLGSRHCGLTHRES